MKLRKILADLCLMLESNDRFVKSDAAAQLRSHPDVVEQIEKYYLPEVTKLICNTDEFLNTDWGKKYKYVKELYLSDTPEIISIQNYIISRKEEDLINIVIPLVSDTHLKCFNQMFDNCEKTKASITDKLKELKDNIKSCDDQIEDTSNKIESLNRELQENQKAEEPEDSIISQNIQKKISTAKGKLTRQQKFRAHLAHEICLFEEKLANEERILNSNKNVIEKINEYLDEYDTLLNEKREKVYNFEFEKKAEEIIVKKLISGDLLNNSEIANFKTSEFLNKFCNYLETSTEENVIIPIIAGLYDDGNIDINTVPIASFLRNHIIQICQYLINLKSTEKSGDYYDWLDFVLNEAIVFNAIYHYDNRFTILWNSFESDEEWLYVLKFYSEHGKTDYDENLCYFLLNTTDEAQRTLLIFAQNRISDEKITFSEFITTLLRCNVKDHFFNTELVLTLIKEFESKQNKLVNTTLKKATRAEARLKRYEDEESSFVYNRLYEPVEKLEKTVMNISPKQVSKEEGSLPYKYVNTVKNDLISHILLLRENMRSFGIEPVGNLVAWSNSEPVDFDNNIHTFIGKKPSEKVKIKTLGFKYTDSDGVSQIRHAEVHTNNNNGLNDNMNKKKQIKPKPKKKKNIKVK